MKIRDCLHLVLRSRSNDGGSSTSKKKKRGKAGSGYDEEDCDDGVLEMMYFSEEINGKQTDKKKKQEVGFNGTFLSSGTGSGSVIDIS